MDTFNRDLARGEQVELAILGLIRKRYPKSYKIEGYFKGYDLFIPETSQKIEVKCDEKSKYTGNIVVEVEFNGKPSALSTTTADIWLWYDGEYLVSFNPEDIWDCIKESKVCLRSFIGKGDSKPKKAYLIPKTILYEYSIKKTKFKI